MTSAETYPDGFWYVSTTFATFGVTVHNGRVVPEHTAPIGRRFAHQPFTNLVRWLQKDRACVTELLLKPGERVRPPP